MEVKSANQYTAEELQQLLDMARVREAEAKAREQVAPRPVVPGSLVKYLDAAGHEHAALVLEVRKVPGLSVNARGERPVTVAGAFVLKLKVFRHAQPNEVVEGRAGEVAEVKEILRVLTACAHPQERVVQIVNDGGRSVIQWCGRCGALRSLLNGSMNAWVRPDVASDVVALAVEAFEVEK